jgi:hypothetical protein
MFLARYCQPGRLLDGETSYAQTSSILRSSLCSSDDLTFMGLADQIVFGPA